MRTKGIQTDNMTDREYRCWRRHARQRRKMQKRYMLCFITLSLVAIFAISCHAVTTSANTGIDEISFKYYTSISVKYGETLWDIADEYIDYNQYKDKNAYIAEVQSINRLDEDGTVKAGQYLIVPYYSSEWK